MSKSTLDQSALSTSISTKALKTFYSSFYSQKDPQEHSDNFSVINHSGHRHMLSCFIVNSILPLMVKIVSSLYDLKEHQWSIAHFYYIFIDALSFGPTALACYQLLFFSYCVKIRYEFLVNFYKEDFKGIKKFDADGNDGDLLQLHSLIDKAITLINCSFTKLVRFAVLISV